MRRTLAIKHKAQTAKTQAVVEKSLPKGSGSIARHRTEVALASCVKVPIARDLSTGRLWTVAASWGRRMCVVSKMFQSKEVLQFFSSL